MTYRRTIEVVNNVLAVMKPPSRQTVSQWADEFRVLSPESSASPGRWKTSVVEYMREPMDTIGDPRVTRVVIKAGAQIAKSELLLNVIGYIAHTDPSPMLMIQPTIKAAEDFSKERLAPMIRDTPVLAEIFHDPNSRDTDNTIAGKAFTGGKISLVGANAPAGLASRPIRVVVCDEVDRYPPSAGTEGDSIRLAIKRTTAFWNRVVVLVSTPGAKETSRIEPAYLEGDQRVRHCPCPDCGEFQPLVWDQVHWQPGRPETAAYTCAHCGSLWSESQRKRAIQAGEWRAQAPFNGVASFHVPGLISMLAPLSDGVREYIETRDDPAQHQVWVNTFLGEVYEDKGKRVDAIGIKDNAEEYETPVPEGVTVITAGIDVQDDRLEIEVVGWGDGHESWSLDYKVFHGDPTVSPVWNELGAFLRQTYVHPSFGELIIRAACLDTGYHTQQAYRFAEKTARVFAIKGIGDTITGKPVIGKASKSNRANVPVYPVGTFTAKELVMNRLRIEMGKPGCCHFPIERDDEYYRQLTAESLVSRTHKGFVKKEWIKNRSRNEAFDCRVYATAAIELLGVNLESSRRVMIREATRAETVEKPVQSNKRRVRYADRWKDWQ